MCQTPTVFPRFYQVDSKYFSEFVTWMNSCFRPFQALKRQLMPAIQPQTVGASRTGAGGSALTRRLLGAPGSFF